MKKDENCFGGSLLWQNLFDEAKRLNRPLFICAPMHDASELAFRLFTKKYGCDLGYTPMVHAVNFAKYKFPRAEEFHSCEEDRPVKILLFLGNVFSITFFLKKKNIVCSSILC